MNDIGDGVFSREEWLKLHTKFGLPPRQRQVIEELFQGRSDKQIADRIVQALKGVDHLGTLLKVDDAVSSAVAAYERALETKLDRNVRWDVSMASRSCCRARNCSSTCTCGRKPSFRPR